MRNFIYRRLSTLTKDRYPHVKRGSYSALQDKDVQYFEGILNKNQIVTDAEEVQSYNSDWLKSVCGYSSIVLKPKTTEQVSVILKYCNDRKLAVCPQGGNTGLVGGSVPVFDEIIISTSLMNKIKDFNSLTGVLVCQSGCVLESLTNFLKEKDFIMPLDLGAKGSCHIGGNVSTNAGGLRLLRYGSLHSTVLGLQAVLANGDVVDCMNTLKKDNTGYHLKHLFIGSEGTLGLVTEVAVHCPPLPKAINLAILGLKSFDHVLNAYKLARSNLAEILSSCEMMDQSSVKVVEENLGISCPLPDMPFYMIIETSGSNLNHDEEKLGSFLETCMNRDVILDGFSTSEPSKMQVSKCDKILVGFYPSMKKLRRCKQALWNIRENITAALLKDGYSYKYDVSLPLNVFYDIILEFRKRLEDLKQVKTICGYGHLGDGNLHVNMTSAEYNEEIKKAIEPYIFEWVSKYRGSISAEHGIGFLKTKYLRFSKTQKEIDIMNSLKLAMDPNGILNPYKVIWEIRERGAEALKLDGHFYTFDISIPLEHFYDGVYVLQDILKDNKNIIHINGFGHLGDGNMHLNVTTEKFDPNLLSFMEHGIFKWTSMHRGSISAEHGIGFLKPEFLHYSKTDKEIELMKQFKNLLDPNGILNPYKVLP